jgi:hypothetical protein
VIVQSLPAHSRLDNNIKVLLVKVDDLVHTAEIDRDALAGRSKVSLETGTTAVTSNGDPAPVAHLHDLRHLLGTRGVDNTEGSVLGASLVRGPAGGSVVFDIVLGGANIFLTNNLAEVSPGGLHILEFCVVLGRCGLA